METENKTIGLVVAHIAKGDTLPSYYVFGDERIRMIVVDDNALHDRVYELLGRDDPNILQELIPEGTKIGNSADGRNEVIAAFIESKMAGKSHLRVIE